MKNQNNIKRIIIALGLVFFAANFASAQGGRQMGTPAERAERQITQLESLKLSSDQKTKLTEVFMGLGKRQDSLRATMNGSFEGMREKMAPIQVETTKKVSLILNDEQKKAYEAILAERRARMNN